jgi:antibiotic biosynthesis monooxygenase (ABM) superfamily enzyme
MEADQPVTVTITRTVKPGFEQQFEQALREFVPISLRFPGHLGVHVHKPMGGTSRDFITLIKFHSAAQWEAFKAWPEYQQWQERIAPMVEKAPRIEEASGLESWFVLPGQDLVRPLPRYKMAIVAWCGVYPTSLLLNMILRPHMQGWPGPLVILVISVIMINLMTWVIMPVLTRVFRRWLYPKRVEQAGTRVARG